MKSHLYIVARLLQVFTDMRGRLGLDAENVHILCAFELAELAHWCRSEPESTHRPEFISELTASTVSEMTLIPRQTVRRRLERLCVLGYLTHLGDGRYAGGERLRDLELPSLLQGIFPTTSSAQSPIS